MTSSGEQRASLLVPTRQVGLGAMRLSTAADRDDERGLAVLCAAIDAGVTLIDTADAYGRDDADAGHNERLVARARALRPRVVVVTKGGLVRPGGAWVPDGRARHLAAAARASRDRLGTIDLYLLHAVDPRVPLATSVRALGKLVEERVVERIGVSNVDRTRLAEACAIAPIAAVSVELSPFSTAPLDGGLVAFCAERGILVLAHRPFGGAANAGRLARHPVIAPLAAELGVSPAIATLAWLRALAPVVVPLPGPTRAGHAYVAPEIARPVQVAVPAAPAVDGDVVLIVGPPGAGKSTLAKELAGYHRLNRDEQGGKLAKLAVMLDGALAGGERRVVLDNTYATRALRAPVVAVARRYGITPRCVVLETSIDDAQVNAIGRLLETYDRLPAPEELVALGKRDPAAFQPSAQFRYRRMFEPPAEDEGFTVERRPFVRRARAEGGKRALIVELHDAVVRDGAELAAWREAGWLVVGTAWLPEGDAEAILAAMRARLPVLADAIACTHPAGPPVCWCRKPIPGMGLVLARRHAIDLAASVHVGRTPADRTFAARLGVRYLDGAEGIPAPLDAASPSARPCSG